MESVGGSGGAKSGNKRGEGDGIFRWFERDGTCPFGDLCLYRHVTAGAKGKASGKTDLAEAGAPLRVATGPLTDRSQPAWHLLLYRGRRRRARLTPLPTARGRLPIRESRNEDTGPTRS